jgi:hypothetical protein
MTWWDYYTSRVSMWLWGLERGTLICGISSTALCLVLMGICVCRLSASSQIVLRRVRLSYSLLGAGAFAAIVLPIAKGEIGVWGALIGLEIAAVAVMLAGSRNWRGGRVPNDVRSDHVPLQET